MIEISNQTRTNVNERMVKRVVLDFLEYFKMGEVEVSIAFVGDVVMRRLNKEYRGKDKVTDVLSFNDDDTLGEIIIDLMQIKRQALKFSNTYKDELIYILVHGMLHLLNYEDETEKGSRKMKDLADQFLDKKKY